MRHTRNEDYLSKLESESIPYCGDFDLQMKKYDEDFCRIIRFANKEEKEDFLHNIAKFNKAKRNAGEVRIMVMPFPPTLIVMLKPKIITHSLSKRLVFLQATESYPP